MLLVDVSITSHCVAPTGVQRVSRALLSELCARNQGLPVCFDRWQGRWRTLNDSERRRLDAPSGAGFTDFRHRWSAVEVLGGVSSRILPGLAGRHRLPGGVFNGMLVPEKLESRRREEILAIRERLSGASVAVFHDLIPIKFPDLATPRSRKEFSAYLDSLLCYDGIAAVSNASRRDLLAYWADRGVERRPPVETIAPGSGFFAAGGEAAEAGTERTPVILIVATLEARKNHLAVLDACERLWNEGHVFALTLVGRSTRDTGQRVLGRIRALQSNARPVRWLGHVSDEAVRRQYQACRFTLQPSLYEGFGLPVLESLGFGKPCIVSGCGALAETATGGGCHILGDATSGAIADAIRALLTDEPLYRRLVRECRQRTFKDWSRYCEELVTWQGSLRKRAVG